MQWEIEQLENELDRLDRSNVTASSEITQFSVFSNYHNRLTEQQKSTGSGTPDVSSERSRSIILSELKQRLVEYGRRP